MNPGILYVVATPIGNLQDITQRSLATLRDVDLIFAEDTRKTRHMLKQLAGDVHAQLLRMDEHTTGIRLLNLVDQIHEGLDAALVSDAGTPQVSDPGGALIAECVARGIRVIPIPGASALTAILSVADFATQPMAFYGFLPKKKGRQTTLKLMTESASKYGLASAVLYESPQRIAKTLSDFAESFGPETHVVVGRELTKMYEELFYGTLAEAIEHFVTPKGEFTILLELPSKSNLK